MGQILVNSDHEGPTLAEGGGGFFVVFCCWGVEYG